MAASTAKTATWKARSDWFPSLVDALHTRWITAAIADPLLSYRDTEPLKRGLTSLRKVECWGGHSWT